MIECPRCGAMCAPDRDFCACGEYVRWEPTPAGTPAVPVIAPIVPAERRDDAMPGDYRPRPGDLIIFSGFSDIGIVERVLDDGSIQTIEGNASDQVARVVRRPGEAWGFVQMGERR